MCLRLWLYTTRKGEGGYSKVGQAPFRIKGQDTGALKAILHLSGPLLSGVCPKLIFLLAVKTTTQGILDCGDFSPNLPLCLSYLPHVVNVSFQIAHVLCDDVADLVSYLQNRLAKTVQNVFEVDIFIAQLMCSI